MTAEIEAAGGTVTPAIVSDDETMLAHAYERFNALHLDWHAARRRR